MRKAPTPLVIFNRILKRNRAYPLAVSKNNDIYRSIKLGTFSTCHTDELTMTESFETVRE
jgi:hypothetical protein